MPRAQYQTMTAIRLLALCCALLAPAAQASLEITVVGGGQQAQPVAIVPMAGTVAGGLDISRVIESDLARTGLFNPLARTDMLEMPSDIAQLNHANWRAVNVDAVVLGQLRPEPGGTRVGLRFWLVDTIRNQQLLGYDMPPVPVAQLRYLAHQVADLVFERLTGIPGAFSTRIAYISATGPVDNRRYQLVVADSDGENPQIIAVSSEPLMSPAWSPDRRQLAYVGYERGRSAVYVHTLESGQARKLVSERGINGSPAWSPDGRQIALTLSFESNPDIYIVDVASGSRRRLTEHYGIDTEAAWSPDGRELIFTSDRGGQPQIYRIPAQGGTPERITFEGRQNLRASYSPDGRKLVLMNLDEGRYRIGVLDLETRYLNLITDGPLDESPCFAPNGAVVMYATQSGNSAELATISLDGRVRTRLRHSGDVREPAWSPLSRQ